MKNWNRIVAGLCSVSLSFMTGCAGFEAEQTFQNTLAAVDEGQKVEEVARPTCEVDYADFELDMHMLAFEIKDKSNFGVGFNLLSGFLRAIGVKFKTERGEMLMSMSLSEALRPMESVVDVTGKGESKGQEFRIELDVLQLGVDLGYYYQTPLSRLTEKTIQAGLSQMNAELKPVDTAWSSRVVFTKEDSEFQEVIMPVGSVGGVRMGDQFNVYNVNYIWDGTPCESRLLFRDRDLTPVATVLVTQLERNASLLTVINKTGDKPIQVGAILEVAKLPLTNGAKSRSLARSVRLRNVISEKLPVQGAAGVDLTLYMREQTTALLNQYGYYPRK